MQQSVRWQENEHLNPKIAHIARRNLCISMNSVSCERMFLKIKLVVGDNRLRFHSAKAGMVAFAATNKVIYPQKRAAKKRSNKNKINTEGKVLIRLASRSTPITPSPTTSTPIPTSSPIPSPIPSTAYSPDLPKQK